MQIKTKFLTAIIVSVLSVAYGLGWSMGRLARDHASEDMITGLNEVARFYTYTIGDLQKRAVEKDVIIASQKVAIKEGLLAKQELVRLKITSVNQITKLQTQVSVLLDSVFHSGTVVDAPCPPDEGYHPVLYLPLVFGEQNRYLKLKGEFDEDGVLSMDINIPANLEVLIGREKGTGKLKSVVTTDSPYIHFMDITTISSGDTREVSRWGLGVTGGLGLMPCDGALRLRPFIGIGVNYNLISW